VNAEFFLATGAPSTHNATLNGFIVGHRNSPEMGAPRNSPGAAYLPHHIVTTLWKRKKNDASSATSPASTIA
jgi:hypothetical protein